jgi:hypothetical protein
MLIKVDFQQLLLNYIDFTEISEILNKSLKINKNIVLVSNQLHEKLGQDV